MATLTMIEMKLQDRIRLENSQAAQHTDIRSEITNSVRRLLGFHTQLAKTPF